MYIYRRIQFKKKELLKIRRDCEGYIWAAVDPKNFIISIGDEYLADLRDVLLVNRSLPENIFGVGLDLETGNIDYVAQINRRNPKVDCSGELSEKDKENVEAALHYFFEKLPVEESAKESKAHDGTDEISDTTIAFF